MAQQPLIRSEITKTAARTKWAIKLKVGPDLTDILGFNQSLTEVLIAGAQAAQSSNLIIGQLQDIGSVESIEIVQNRSLLERYAFGPNPGQPFQIAPQQVTVSLRLSKVILKKPSLAESVFNFFPNNLLFQQVPFVIYLRDIGSGNPADNTFIEHYFFGCWFADSTVTYDVTSKSDQILINNANVKVTRMLTLDPTNAGNPAAVIAKNAIQGILAVGDAQNLLDDLELT